MTAPVPATCLSEEDVIELVEGRLALGRLQDAELHLDGCLACSDLVAAAAGALSRQTSSSPPALVSLEGVPAEGMGPVASPDGYKIVSALGGGGMGIVYRAVRRSTGEPVALKTVPVRSTDALAAIRREIYSLGRLNHPGVVKILDQGVFSGRPWYAMELVEGESFDQYLRRVRKGGRRSFSELSTWNETLEKLGDLCDALACLHANGFVHCDVTPRNVILGRDGRPVLVDFGLALRNDVTGRDLLDTLALGGGTVAYMAPEQIRGEALDPRTDLYALGCMLYEAVTGGPVFVGANRMAVLQCHLNQKPTSPSQKMEGVPRELEDLILTLLEKRPQDRVGYADDVASALRLFRAGQPRPVSTSRLSYLYRPEFVGRERPLKAIRGALERLAAVRMGGRFHVAGESGVGKTRLASEAVRLATQLSVTVVVGNCGALAGTSVGGELLSQGPLHPLSPLLLAIADRCRQRGERETERILGAGLRILAAYQPELLDLL